MRSVGLSSAFSSAHVDGYMLLRFWKELNDMK